jgi:hypothetical protein
MIFEYLIKEREEREKKNNDVKVKENIVPFGHWNICKKIDKEGICDHRRYSVGYDLTCDKSGRCNKEKYEYCPRYVGTGIIENFE